MSMIAASHSSAKQNAHLTFKQNQKHGRHGWLRLTPAYSVTLVSELISKTKNASSILDPFSGTGTTALSAAYLGLYGTGIEINPFLVWFSELKGKNYSQRDIAKVTDCGSKVADLIHSAQSRSCDPPPIHNIERWWGKQELDFLCKLKASIHTTTDDRTNERDILLVAFCRTLIKLSNAAFNHQSLSFKTKDTNPTLFDSHKEQEHSALFLGELRTILLPMADNPSGEFRVVKGDARQPSRVVNQKFDMLITSPPYPNRISYIRELRPYMYWLDFLTNGRDAGEFDWQAIGGTWGVATSRLSEWTPSQDAFKPKSLQRALDAMLNPSNKNGALLSRYVEKYFEDMWRHISDLQNILNDRAEVHYIVGNSTFYGTLLSVEEIYKEMLEAVGFTDLQIVKLRKRNSKAELFEFDVRGRG